VEKNNQKLLLKLARESILENLTAKGSPTLELLEQSKIKELCGNEGSFVTLRIGDNLRGCIGNIIGEKPLYRQIYRLAKESAFGDPRFRALSLAEADQIKIEISILTVPKVIKNVDEIVLGRDGVILTSGFQRALFLPQVALEQEWDLETMLINLSLKANLQPTAWQQHSTKFEVFQATVFEES
jgi:AmmeMemoRadiSam system protein A